MIVDNTPLEEYELETIAFIRSVDKRFIGIPDIVIARAFCWYCAEQHAANWIPTKSEKTAIEFADWAFMTPIDEGYEFMACLESGYF